MIQDKRCYNCTFWGKGGGKWGLRPNEASCKKFCKLGEMYGIVAVVVSRDFTCSSWEKNSEEYRIL